MKTVYLKSEDLRGVALSPTTDVDYGGLFIRHCVEQMQKYALAPVYFESEWSSVVLRRERLKSDGKTSTPKNILT